MMPAPGNASFRRPDIVGRAAVGVMSLLLMVMLLRVAQLQLAPSPELAEHVQTRVTKRTVAAARSDIMDRRFRYLATTQFGYRVFIDPVEFPSPPDEAIVQLADTLCISPEAVGGPLMNALAENKLRAAAAQEAALPTPPAKQGMSGVYERLKTLLGGAPKPPAATVNTNGNDWAPECVEADGTPTAERKPVRYVRVSEVLSDEQVDAIKGLRVPGVHLEQESVRRYPSGELAASIVGQYSDNPDGTMGAERSYDKELAGVDGRINYVRDARGRPLWMGPGAYIPAKRGKDLRLSLDLEIQRLATEELQRGVNECDAAGGRLIVMDAASGEILAMVDLLRPVPDAVPFPWPDAVPAVKGPHGRLLYEPPPAIPRARYITIKPDLGRMVIPAMARNRCVEDLYEPGSTFKPFVWATITELGLMKPDEVLDTGNGYWRTPYGRLVHDVHAKPSLSWFEVLVNSSNIGMGKGAEKMTHDQMYAAIRRFGFGGRTGIGLQGETAGMVTPRKQWSKYTQTSVSFGQEVAVTPVQMARAFSAFARTGELTGTLPQARLQALDEDDPTRSLVHRVLKPNVVMLTRKALRKVALEMEGKMLGNKQHPEGGWKYTIFGKSGTAQIPLGKAPKGKRKPAGPGYYAHQYNASFIAAGPAENPKLVCLVVIDDPGPELVKHAQYYGALTAGPVVRRVLERSLAYLGVPPSPPGETAKPIDASTHIAD